MAHLIFLVHKKGFSDSSNVTRCSACAFADVSAQLLGLTNEMKQAQVLLVVWLCCQKLFKCVFKAGVKVVAELNQLEHKIANADWVITVKVNLTNKL
jgi:hypothetical protein